MLKLLNKLIIPSILGIIVLIAGVSAFSPLNEATTVHTTVTSAISISDVFADVGTADSANNDEITVDFVISEQSGDVIAGLVAGDFATDFIAGTTVPGAVTVVVTESGSGGYRLTIAPTNNWDAGRTNIVLTATSDALEATTLIVVDLD